MDFKAMFESIKDFMNLPYYMKIIIGIFLSSSIFIFPSLSNKDIFKVIALFGFLLILLGLA